MHGTVFSNNVVVYNYSSTGVWIALLALFLVMLAVQIFICYLLQTCYNRVPEDFRQLSPGLVWLLLIPIFGLVWNFFVFLKLANSYKAYFTSVAKPHMGDCGRALGLAYCICACLSIIPLLGYLTGIAALILLIILMVKMVGLRNQIPLAPAAPVA